MHLECIRQNYLLCNKHTCTCLTLKLGFLWICFATFFRGVTRMIFFSLTSIYTTNTNVKDVENLLLLEKYFSFIISEKRETLMKKASNVLNPSYHCTIVTEKNPAYLQCLYWNLEVTLSHTLVMFFYFGKLTKNMLIGCDKKLTQRRKMKSRSYVIL
jgi:hypothetical protein